MSEPLVRCAGAARTYGEGRTATVGLQPTDVTDWQFVEVNDVPPGPWRTYGDNNHFVVAKRQTEQKLVQSSQPKKK